MEVIAEKLEEQGKDTELEILRQFEQEFLFEGYEEYFKSLIHASDVFPLVFCHNDINENNILMSRQNNGELILIDYEYAKMNPMSFDIGNYLVQTMTDNSHPGKSGVACYE